MAFLLVASPQNPYGKSSLKVVAYSRVKFPEDMKYNFGYESGLIYSRYKLVFNMNQVSISEEGKDTLHAICNHSTGKCAFLPGLISYGHGFEHTEFCEHRILTLGAGNDLWRKIYILVL